MVCAKCQRLEKRTQLATPEVKKKNDPSSAAASSKKGPSSAGISKSKLLSKSAKNPYAAYSSSCDGCKTKVESGRKYCQRCSYSKQLCAMCGKSLSGQGSTSKTPVVQGQKFTAK
ncbi:hypothetical protein K461DRAFT_316135 [Myriangium duriaei CBS 260.36]|uniref:Cysteine-rich PDZ-binding protein n=1 Tax=Myriangium duriaei CBS 260.36 TaxID=1168546 RepID=A0A9P4MHW2_9PEZI|nr:hypothetical protein K461DRAFT_316135 [Myriangium duriaei CBS 260.36]